MKQNQQNESKQLVLKQGSQNGGDSKIKKNNFENSAQQKVVLIGKKDLEKNSVISRSTKGGFKSGKKNQVFMFDPDANKLKEKWVAPKKIELDEEEYFDTLEKIIQRDFFPTLYRPPKGDGEGLSEFGSQTRGSSKRRPPTKLNLNEFLRRYSSEDNVAFDELHEKDRQKFMKRISWMYDESAKYNKLNQLALEHGHKNQGNTGRPNFLISSAEDAEKVQSGNTRSIPQIGYYGKSDPMSSLFFNSGQGSGFENQKMLVSEEDHERKKVIKENTRFDEEFMEKQHTIENKILFPYSRQNQQNSKNEGPFKVPKPKYKVQGIKAREAIGLYLADNTVTAKKKREAKLLEKGSKLQESSENGLRPLQQRSPGQNLIPNLTSSQSERSFKTQLSKFSKTSRLSQGSVKSTTSIRNQISAMSASGQNLLKTVMKKRRPDSLSQF